MADIISKCSFYSYICEQCMALVAALLGLSPFPAVFVSACLCLEGRRKVGIRCSFP